jgi:hypothetical protein
MMRSLSSNSMIVCDYLAIGVISIGTTNCCAKRISLRDQLYGARSHVRISQLEFPIAPVTLLKTTFQLNGKTLSWLGQLQSIYHRVLPSLATIVALCNVQCSFFSESI